MEPARRLAPLPGWMTDAGTQAVLAALSAGGSEVRFVGGCVRDAVAGRSVVDIDIATPEPPETVVERLHAAGIHSIPTGIAHGTVTAVSGGQHFEVTTLRVDVETYGRHAKVAFTDDWSEDAARRDFTMNAMSCTAVGDVFDPWGGIADLEAGHVRFVGDAARRIEEDHLRLLRFFRFHAWYGRGLPDEAALTACATWAGSLAALSGERLRNETLKLLAAPDPLPAVDLMIETRVLAELLPGAAGRDLLAALMELDSTTNASGDSVLRLAALLREGTAAVDDIAARHKLSNAQAERLRKLVTPPLDVGAARDPAAVRLALYRLGAEVFTDLTRLAQASTSRAGEADNARFKAMLEAAADWKPVSLPVRGADVLALGIPAGPRVGEILEAVEAWWIAEDFRPGREAALEKLGALISAERPD